MYCPECRAEFREGITICPDCEVPLVEELPDESTDSPEDLVRIFETADVAVLPVIKSVLSAADIPYIVQGDEIMGVIPVGGIGLGGLSPRGHGLSAAIWVPHDRADEARALLNEAPEIDTDN